MQAKGGESRPANSLSRRLTRLEAEATREEQKGSRVPREGEGVAFCSPVSMTIQCYNSICPREATVESEVIGVPTTAPTSATTRKVLLCQPCADQDKRNENDSRPGLSR